MRKNIKLSRLLEKFLRSVLTSYRQDFSTSHSEIFEGNRLLLLLLLLSLCDLNRKIVEFF